MHKNLVAVLVTIGLGATAAAFIATSALAQLQAPAPGTPRLLLAQATPAPAPPGRGPAARGRGPAANRPAPTAADRTARRDAQCQETYARAAGRFAALEVRLNLTGAQVPAFARWRDQRLAAAKSRSAECAARPLPPQPGAGRGPAGRGPNATPPSPVERLTREEAALQRRLSDIQAERPALEALWGSLNASQRQTLSRVGARESRPGLGRGGFRRPGMNRGGPRGGMMFRRGAMDPGIIARPGMQGRGPVGSGAMRGRPQGNPPPPPPAQ